MPAVSMDDTIGFADESGVYIFKVLRLRHEDNYVKRNI